MTDQETAPRTIAEIVATVKGNLANGTAVLGPTHYDKNGAPIDLSGRRPALPQSTAEFHQQFPCRQDYLRKHCRHGCAACEDAPEQSDPLSDTDLPFESINDDWQESADDADTEYGDY